MDIPLRETKGSEGELAPIEHGLRCARVQLHWPCLRENLKHSLEWPRRMNHLAHITKTNAARRLIPCELQDTWNVYILNANCMSSLWAWTTSGWETDVFIIRYLGTVTARLLASIGPLMSTPIEDASDLVKFCVNCLCWEDLVRGIWSRLLVSFASLLWAIG